jgi:hypothetical protein
MFVSGRSRLHIEVTLRSGRRFRYDLSDYRFGPELTEMQARILAEQIAAEKYKYAEWDRDHPRVLAEAEIADSLYGMIMKAVGNMQAAADASPE